MSTPSKGPVGSQLPERLAPTADQEPESKLLLRGGVQRIGCSEVVVNQLDDIDVHVLDTDEVLDALRSSRAHVPRSRA